MIIKLFMFFMRRKIGMKLLRDINWTSSPTFEIEISDSTSCTWLMHEHTRSKAKFQFIQIKVYKCTYVVPEAG